MKTRSISHSLFRNGVAAILAGLLLSPWTAQAVTKTWNCTNSWWDLTNCWSPTGVPVLADDVTAGPVSATNTFLRFDSATGTRSANSLVINSGTANAISFVQSGGNLTITTDEVVGSTGTGAFTHSGGTNTVNNYLYLGYNSGSNGSYALSGTGSLSAYQEFIGYSGAGAFTQSGGTNTVNYLYLGSNSGSNGTYSLSGSGSLTAGTENIGYSGTGAFTQSGGTHTINNNLTLGSDSTGSGIYNLSGGTLNVGGDIVNGTGSSTFNLDGGALNVTGSSISLDFFRIGNASGSNGSFTLGSGKTLTAVTEVIGYSGTGSFTQSGGTHTVSGNLNLGYNSGSNGTYNLNAGSLLNGGNEYIGFSGTGNFTQSGGTHTVGTYLFLGYNYGSTGSYTLSGGTLNVAADIGDYAGNGTFNLDGGTLNVTGSFIDVANFRLGNAAGSNGNFMLASGKTLMAGTEVIGNNGTGTFTNSGGTNTVGTLAINNGTYTLSGGTLTVNTSMDNSGVFELAGGTLTGNGTLANNNLVSGFGTIGGSGGFVSNALLTQNGGNITLTNTGANANYGNIDLATPYQLRLNGANLSNSGTINLNSAVVTGTGTLNNTYGGVIAGRGTISSNFSNSGGVLAVGSSTTNITKAFSNSGAIQLGGPTASLTGGTITNTGTIEGVGSVGNSISNTGIVRAGAGTLTLSGASVGNNAGGLMTAPAGGTILAANGMSANAGTVNLTGGTFDNNNHALTNTGQISGYGTLRTGGLSNQGSMTLTGGTTTVNGNLTNAAAANLKVAYNPAIFTGNVVNQGTVKTTQTTVTFAGSYTENGVFISDPSNNYFTDVVIGANGYWTGGAGDNFFISGNFVNNSLQNLLWNTDAASLFLNGSGLQNLYLAGSDLGALFSGYNNNFSWGEFSLGSGVSAHLWDGNANSGAALYVGQVDLGGGLGQLANIYSDYNIYYNPNAAGNSYLGGLKYALNGAGFLAPAVPIPPAVWLFGSGLLGLVGIARRKARPTRTAHRNVKAGHVAGVTRRTYMSE